MPDRVAILLCAGYGTRMGELTAETPKPLLPLAGKPILDYLLEQLLELDGLDAIHLVSNSRYLAAFESWAADRRGGIPLTVHDDGSTSAADRLGAVGDLDFVLRRIPVPAGALVAAGDNVLRFSLRPFWRAFLDSGRSQVLGLEEADAEKLRRTGVLELAPDGRVLALHEKPEDPPSTWACPPLYAFQPRALEAVGGYLAAGNSADEIGRFVCHLVSRQPVYVFEAPGGRLHVGDPDAYRHAEKVLRRL